MKRFISIQLAAVFLGIFTNSSYAADSGITGLRYVTLLVPDQDAALNWYTQTLGLEKVEDRSFGPGRRWLVVAPQKGAGVGIVLDVPHGDFARQDRVGKETDWVFRVADCQSFYDRLQRLGVHVLVPPKRQPWGTMQVMFEDPYGNIFVAEGPAGVAADPSDSKSDRK